MFDASHAVTPTHCAIETPSTPPNDGLRRLLARYRSVIEDERANVASEMHNFVGATLVLIQRRAINLKTKLATMTVSPDDTDVLQRMLEEADRISRMTRMTYGAARLIERKLRPHRLETSGLNRAMAELVREFDSATGHTRFTFQASRALPRVSRTGAIATYRVVQEALTNVLQHANATSACVTLSTAPGESALRIEIWDNGVGFANHSEAMSRGLGLLDIRERVAQVGGTISINSGPAGTLLDVRLPRVDMHRRVRRLDD